MYKIKIEYQTGDSFGSHTEIDMIELDFTSIEICKKNIDRIKNHYNMVQALDSYTNKKNSQKILSENVSNDWFVCKTRTIAYKDEENKDNEYQAIDSSEVDKYTERGWKIGTNIHQDDAAYSIILFTDLGKPFQLSCYWVGYFETLISVEMVLNDDYKIEF